MRINYLIRNEIPADRTFSPGNSDVFADGAVIDCPGYVAKPDRGFLADRTGPRCSTIWSCGRLWHRLESTVSGSAESPLDIVANLFDRVPALENLLVIDGVAVVNVDRFGLRKQGGFVRMQVDNFNALLPILLRVLRRHATVNMTQTARAGGDNLFRAVPDFQRFHCVFVPVNVEIQGVDGILIQHGAGGFPATFPGDFSMFGFEIIPEPDSAVRIGPAIFNVVFPEA